MEQLEARMNEVLQLCAAWRCVCLLDEGDALVERREKVCVRVCVCVRACVCVCVLRAYVLVAAGQKAEPSHTQR